MSWNQAEQYCRALRDAVRMVDDDPAGPLPWRDEWEPVLGSPEQLYAALRTRWATMVEAQFPDATIAELAATHPGLARLSGVASGVELAAS